MGFHLSTIRIWVGATYSCVYPSYIGASHVVFKFQPTQLVTTAKLSMSFHSIFRRRHSKELKAVGKVIDQELSEPVDHILPPNKHLDDIPDDILHLIIQATKDTYGITFVRPLSLVCQRIRFICLPYLFRDHCWRPSTREHLLLPEFWKYVR